MFITDRTEHIDRPRRNRRTEAIRRLVRETEVTPRNLVMPLFVKEGVGSREAISSMPGMARLSRDLAAEECRALERMGITSVALFPAISDEKKDSKASESANPNGLLPDTIKAIKDACSDICVITDVALDPYSSDGHDGLVKDGNILNDETLPLLSEMAVMQARAGADIVAPSDMMDGRVGYIRQALDESGKTETGILAYSVKYASAFYGPFRDALDSAPKSGDKKTYQMDPANVREAIREVDLDIVEGADMVMVKPALAYLDVIAAVKSTVTIPVAAYNVSGEYALVKAAAEKGWIDAERGRDEMLVAIKRAGADIILSYFAKEFAQGY